MAEPEYKSHLMPQTLWEKLYLAWFLTCFLMVYVGTWAVNEVPRCSFSRSRAPGGASSCRVTTNR